MCVQAQRTRKNPRKNIWEELDQERFARDAPDISAILEQRAAVSVMRKRMLWLVCSDEHCAYATPSVGAA